MLGRARIVPLTLIIAAVAIITACGNPGESIVAQPTALPLLGEITAITGAPSDSEDELTTHGSASSSGVAPPAIFITTCGVCHAVAGTNAAGNIGPELTHIGTVASTRTNLSAEDYIRQSIQEPSAFVTPEFGNLMPSGLATALGPDFDAVVTYLVGLE